MGRISETEERNIDDLDPSRGIITALIISVAFWVTLFFSLAASAASVVTTQVITDLPQADGRRYVEYRFDLLDNNNGNHVEYIGPKLVPADFDTDADMLALIPVVLETQANREIFDTRSDLASGADPFHVDLGGFFEKATPDWQTWDELFVVTAKYYWALPDQLGILPFKASWSRVSNTDKRDILGITNQDITRLNAAMQAATDISATLSTYLPFYDEDGNPL